MRPRYNAMPFTVVPSKWGIWDRETHWWIVNKYNNPRIMGKFRANKLVGRLDNKKEQINDNTTPHYMLKRYRIDITEHYYHLPQEGTWWIVYAKIGKDTIITEGATIPEVYQNLSDALSGLAASYRKER